MKIDFETSIFRGENQLEHVLHIETEAEIKAFQDSVHDEIGCIPVYGMDDFSFNEVSIWNISEDKQEYFGSLSKKEKEHINSQIETRIREKFYSIDYDYREAL